MSCCGCPGFFFLLDVLEPLGIGHGGSRSDHADPGPVGGLGQVDRDIEAAGEDGESGDVVDVLVGDEDGVEGCRVFSGQGHAAQQLAAGEAGVDQNAGAGGRDDGAVAFGAGGEHCHAHHWSTIRLLLVGFVGWSAGDGSLVIEGDRKTPP